MTHLDIYSRLSRFDRKAGIKALFTLGFVLLVMFIGIAIVPERWVENFITESSPNIMSVDLSEGSRFMLVPFILSGPFVIGALVTGVISAAETRSYLGAGVTRRAKWLDDRRTNLGVSAVLLFTLTVSILLALVLDGASGFQAGDTLKSLGIFFVTMLLAYEVGSFYSLLYTRLGWIVATIAAIVFTVLVIVALGNTIVDGETVWRWYRVVSIILVTTLTLPASYQMLVTVPMRRRG